MNATLAPPPTVTATDRVFRDRLAGDDLRELVPDPKVVLDCGAGGGHFARSARNIWPNAKIHSFEPSTRFNLKLKTMDGLHEVHRVAVGGANGMACLNTTHGPESNSILEFLEGGPLEKIHRVVGHETVPIVTLDKWADPALDVDVLKLDVQGAEIEVLEGAQSLIQRCRPVIYAEVAFQPLYKDHPLLEDVDAFMATMGYRRLYLYASPMPDLWGDAIYVPRDSETGAQPIRLNIGAGDTVIPGFTAIDRKFDTEAYPLNYPDNSVEEIRCVHMLEHLSFGEVIEALKEWHRVLKPGGVLRISVPDVHKCVSLHESDPHWRFYIMGGQTDANDFHKSAWDERTLRHYLNEFGFENVERWSSVNTDLAASDISLNLQGTKGTSAKVVAAERIKTRAIIGMPRIGWNDAWQSIVESMHALKIPIETHQGCFWGQNVQKAMVRALRDGIDWLITLDYDSMIMPAHVNRLLEIMGSHPEIDAIAALQMRRGCELPLFSTGKTEVELDWEPYKVNTAHFGLTILRMECLKSMEKPWLIDIPDKNGEFNGEHTDADITFWKKWTEAGNTVYVAPDVRIGHLELVVSEFDEELKPRHLHVSKWWNKHHAEVHCMRS